jgi:hypothetical protein
LLIDKNLKFLIIAIIVVVLISSSVTYLFVRSNNTVSTNSAGNFTELYLFVPNGTVESKVATLPDGTSFNFTTLDSRYTASINDTLNMSFAIGNREGQSMNYTLVVFQSDSTNMSAAPNVTQLYVGATRMMADKDTLVSWIQIKPAYANNNTQIGIALLDVQPDGNSTPVNSSEINANIVM